MICFLIFIKKLETININKRYDERELKINNKIF
jgi:hypothetical protein